MTKGFDTQREGTGTKEWAEETVNIQTGCANNCRYCYAARNAHRFGQRTRDQWQDEVLTKRAQITSYPARDGVVMFPSAHDITPFNLEHYIRVAELILKKGNHLLIVTKPRMDCIPRLVDALGNFQDQILFRFTIGTINERASLFWEPGAPLPNERLSCLERAFDNGFRTSVSIEPLLGGFNDACMVVEAAKPFVTDTIWIGKMNKINVRVQGDDDETKRAVLHIRQCQTDEEILCLYDYFKDDPMIRWKDSINEVVKRCR